MLARANSAECRAVKPRPNAKDGVKHASTEIKGCLSAICAASPELLADPNTDHSVYAIDPLQTPELSVGYGLLKWALSESRRVVGVVTEDYVDGEEMEVLEVKISLTPTVAVSREQHAHSLQGLSNPKLSSANPSPPTTPLPQPNQPTRASTRVRVRTRKDKSTTPPPPAAKRGRPRRANSPVAPAPSGARSNSPGPSRTHSRVSSVSSLALSQTQVQPGSKPPSRAPASSASQTRTSHTPTSQQDSQSESSRTLARLLSSSSNTSSASGTPMLDSLLQRIKSGGLASALQATGLAVQANESGSGPSVKLEGVSDAQQQALLALLKFASSNSSNGTAGEADRTSRTGVSYFANSPAGGAAPSPVALAAPSPRPFAVPSPASVSAPSPAASIIHRPSSSASVSGYLHTDTSRPTSSLGVRKREMDDGEIVEIDPTESLDSQNEPKRAKMNAGEVRTTVGGTSNGQVVGSTPLGDVRSWSTGDVGFGNAASSPSMSAASPQLSTTSSALSPNNSISSPNISAAIASPSVSAASPAISAASPYMAVPSPAPSTVSPAISAASPYPYPYPVSAPPMSNPRIPLGPPRVLTATLSQPNLSFSQPAPPQSTASTSSRKRTTRGSAQTDLPAWSGSFITPRDQIGQPRAPAPVEAPPPPPARKSAPGPSRPKATAAKNKEDAARKVRGVSEEEVQDMLAGGYYPSGGLQDEHRRLFGAGSKSGKSTSAGNAGDTGNTGAKESNRVDEGKVGGKTDPVGAPNAPLHSSSAPVSTSSRPPSSAGTSTHYRSTSTASTAPAPPPRPRQPRAPAKTPRQRPPTIPKHSPVALPAVSRLPMMMTSPIRATGAPGSTAAGQSLSLKEYSPLRRLLKTAGVDKIEDVLGQGGVLGLKGASGWRSTTGSSRAGGKAAMKREQQREVVDLTSDADDEEDPPPEPVAKQRLQTPPRSGAPQPQESRPSTPPRRQTPYVAVTPPRKAHTSPPRQPESPLFNPAEPIYATSSDAPENLPMPDGAALPMDLPPSSPPPMSDSESASGLEHGGNEYRENTQEEYSSDAPIPDLGLQDIGTDEEDGGWDETIRPAEPAAPEDAEPIGQFLSTDHLGFLSSDADLDLGLGLGSSANGNPQLDLEALSSLLNMLEPPTSEVDVDAEINMNTVLEGAQVSALDFSWLDALGNGEGQEMDLNVVGLHEQNIPPPSDTDGEGMSEAELAQILAAFGTS